MNTKSFRRSKRATIACINSFRIPIAVLPRLVGARHLVEYSLVLGIAQRQIVGIHRVMKGADPVALDGFGDDGNRYVICGESAGAFIPRSRERTEIVALDGNSVKTEGAQLAWSGWSARTSSVRPIP